MQLVLVHDEFQTIFFMVTVMSLSVSLLVKVTFVDGQGTFFTVILPRVSSIFYKTVLDFILFEAVI